MKAINKIAAAILNKKVVHVSTEFESQYCYNGFCGVDIERIFTAGDLEFSVSNFLYLSYLFDDGEKVYADNGLHFIAEPQEDGQIDSQIVGSLEVETLLSEAREMLCGIDTLADVENSDQKAAFVFCQFVDDVVKETSMETIKHLTHDDFESFANQYQIEISEGI